MINRKQCLRKINEDLRKRNKNKGSDGIQTNSSSQSTDKAGNSSNQPKSFGSASIALNNLINIEPEPKPE